MVDLFRLFSRDTPVPSCGKGMSSELGASRHTYPPRFGGSVADCWWEGLFSPVIRFPAWAVRQRSRCGVQLPGSRSSRLDH